MNDKRAIGGMLICLGLGLNVSAAINKHFPGPNTYELLVITGSILLIIAAVVMRSGRAGK